MRCFISAGSDANPGTFSLPWKTLHKALTDAIVQDFNTIIVLSGYYIESNFSYIKKSNLVIKGQGNVVIDGYFPEFKHPQQTQPWQLWNTSKGIYRLVNAYNSDPWNPLNRDQVKGTFIYGNEEHRLVVRKQIGSHQCYYYKDLATDNQFWSDDPEDPVYVGPGLYHDTEGLIDPANPCRLYIRLKPSRYMSQQDSAYSLYSFNPNDFSMNIGYQAGSWIQLDSCHNVRFENMHL